MIKILNIDCMEYMRNITDKHFELAIVDPPYGININMNIGRRKKDLKKHSKKNWDNAVPNDIFFKELFRISKEQIIWGSNNFINIPPSNGWIVWDKDITGDVQFSQCELAYCSIGNTIKKFTYRAQTNENYSVKIHPCQKPVALYKWLLSKYAKPNDKILDTHLGSGSIAIACHDLGFDLTACELDKEYYNAAINRLRLHQQQQKLPL